MRTYAMISDPWPYRRQLLNGFILDTINMTVVRWRRNKLSVEKGYYLEHKKVMGELVCISKYLCVGYAQVIHKMALLCPVSETEEKRLWARKFQLYKQKKTRENNVTQKPQITWSSLKGNSWSNHWKTITKDSKRCTNTQSQQVTHYSQLFDDLASSCGEIKKAASNAIHAHYDLFPSKDSNFLKAQTCNHVKEITTELIKKSLFAHSSNDEKVHVQFLSLDFIHAPWRTTWSPLVTQPSVNCFTSLCMAMSIGSEIFEQKNLDTIFWMGHYLLPSPR